MTQEDLDAGRLYPPPKKIREVSVKIATDISEWYYKVGQATLYPVPEKLEEYLRKNLYDTTYTSYVPNTWKYPNEHTCPRSYTKVNKP